MGSQEISCSAESASRTWGPCFALQNIHIISLRLKGSTLRNAGLAPRGRHSHTLGPIAFYLGMRFPVYAKRSFGRFSELVCGVFRRSGRRIVRDVRPYGQLRHRYETEPDGTTDATM
jgi:hypothetical protein